MILITKHSNSSIISPFLILIAPNSVIISLLYGIPVVSMSKTQYSQMDGITPVEDLINRARKWGMKSIAITDHGVAQSFPHANDTVKKGNNDIKVLYGVEGIIKF